MLVVAHEVSMFHSVITLKNQGLSGGLLHSTFKHSQKVQNNNKLLLMVTKIQTTIGFSKELEDNLIMILLVTPTDIEYIFDGMHVRLMHPQTGRNLHTHDIPAPVSKSEYEVACYGNLTIGDPKDNWIVEIMEQASDEDKMRLHPLTSSFRLKNEVMNCYLGSLVLHYLNGVQTR